MSNKRIELKPIIRTVENNLGSPKDEWQPLPEDYDWIALVIWQGIRNSEQLEKYGVFEEQPVIDHFFLLIQKMVAVCNSK